MVRLGEVGRGRDGTDSTSEPIINIRLGPRYPGRGRQNFSGAKVLEAAKFKERLKFKNRFNLVILYERTSITFLK